jgi:hypothetical protein
MLQLWVDALAGLDRVNESASVNGMHGFDSICIILCIFVISKFERLCGFV